MEESERPNAAEAAPAAEALIPARTLVAHFREVVPLLLGGSEGELFSMLSLDESSKTLIRLGRLRKPLLTRQVYRRLTGPCPYHWPIRKGQRRGYGHFLFFLSHAPAAEEQADEEQPPVFLISLEVLMRAMGYV